MKTKNNALHLVRKYFPQVEIVVDSGKSVIIEVTPGDASSRDLKNPAACAFARATKRTFVADGVIIGRTTSYVVINKKASRYMNPETVTREIVSFDRGAGFYPGIYVLSRVNPSRRLGVSHRGGNSTGKHGKRLRHVTANVRVLGEK